MNKVRAVAIMLCVSCALGACLDTKTEPTTETKSGLTTEENGSGSSQPVPIEQRFTEFYSYYIRSCRDNQIPPMRECVFSLLSASGLTLCSKEKKHRCRLEHVVDRASCFQMGVKYVAQKNKGTVTVADLVKVTHDLGDAYATLIPDCKKDPQKCVAIACKKMFPHSSAKAHLSLERIE